MKFSEKYKNGSPKASAQLVEKVVLQKKLHKNQNKVYVSSERTSFCSKGGRGQGDSVPCRRSIYLTFSRSAKLPYTNALCKREHAPCYAVLVCFVILHKRNYLFRQPAPCKSFAGGKFLFICIIIFRVRCFGSGINGGRACRLILFLDLFEKSSDVDKR